MKPVGIGHFTEYLFPCGLRANARGDVCFATKRANLQQDGYDTALWLLQNGAVSQLDAPKDLRGHWWRDERRLLLAAPGDARARRNEEKGLPTTRIRLLDTQGGALRTLFRLHHDVEDLAALPNGGLVLLLWWDPRVDAALEKAAGDEAEAARALKEDAHCEVLESLPFWENGGGFTGQKRRRLFSYHRGRLRPLTDTHSEVERLAAAPDGTLYYTLRDYAPRLSPHNRLFRLGAPGGDACDISLGSAFRHDAAVPLGDGTLVVFGCDMRRAGLNQNPALYHVGKDGVLSTLDDSGRYGLGCGIATDLSMAQETPPFAQNGGACWVSTVNEGSHLLHIHAGTGALARLSRAPGAVLEAVPMGNSCCIIALRGQAGPEVYQLTPGGGETRLTQLNAAVQKQYRLAAPTPLACKNAQGVEIRGFVLKPPQLAENARCPVILSIHGGPKAAYGPVLFHEMQYWAAQGYAVVFCNPTGSDGRGDAFADIRGQYGAQDSADILAFLDAALAAHPFMDGARAGVTGGSYGGFMTNWLIGHTRRFKAAASQRSIANWATMFTLSDIGRRFVADQVNATPWQDAEKLWACSPLQYAPDAKTPTLFLHSDEDYRCPENEGLQMYAALMHFGVEARLCLFHGENHELSRSGKPKGRLRRLREITAWFDRYLKPGE